MRYLLLMFLKPYQLINKFSAHRKVCSEKCDSKSKCIDIDFNPGPEAELTSILPIKTVYTNSSANVCKLDFVRIKYGATNKAHILVLEEFVWWDAGMVLQ